MITVIDLLSKKHAQIWVPVFGFIRGEKNSDPSHVTLFLVQ